MNTGYLVSQNTKCGQRSDFHEVFDSTKACIIIEYEYIAITMAYITPMKSNEESL